MSTATSIDPSFHNFYFPPVPRIDGKLRIKPSLAAVIHSSFSGWDPEKSSAYSPRSIEVRNATTRISETLDASPITDGASISESEAEYDGVDDEEREVSFRNYLNERSEALANEYLRKVDFGKENRKKFQVDVDRGVNSRNYPKKRSQALTDDYDDVRKADSRFRLKNKY